MLVVPHNGQVVSYSIAMSGEEMALVYNWHTVHAREVYVMPLARSDRYGWWHSYFGDVFSTVAISDMMLHLDDSVYYLPLLIDETYGWLREFDREFISASEVWHRRIVDKLFRGDGTVSEWVIAVYALLDVYADDGAYIALVERSRALDATHPWNIGDWRTNVYIVALYNDDDTFTLTALPSVKYTSLKFGQFASVVLMRMGNRRSDDIMEIVDMLTFLAAAKRVNAIDSSLRQMAATVKQLLLHGE